MSEIAPTPAVTDRRYKNEPPVTRHRHSPQLMPLVIRNSEEPTGHGILLLKNRLNVSNLLE